MDLINSTVLSQGTFTIQPKTSFFRKFSSEVEKCIMWSSIQVLSKQASKNPSIRLKIFTYESPMQRYIEDRVKLWEQSQFKG